MLLGRACKGKEWVFRETSSFVLARRVDIIHVPKSVHVAHLPLSQKINRARQIQAKKEDGARKWIWLRSVADVQTRVSGGGYEVGDVQALCAGCLGSQTGNRN
jgi:hypothetical protein